MSSVYLHLGKTTDVKTSDIVGIFDLDTATIQKDTRDFLYNKEKEGKVVSVFDEKIPKSFTIVQSSEGEKVYIGPLMVSTLMSRLSVPQQIKPEEAKDEDEG